MNLAATALFLLLAPCQQDRETCVTAGLRWLIRHQSADGRWSDTDFVTQCRQEDGGPCGAKGEAVSDVGATAMALLSFHGAGYTRLTESDEVPGAREVTRKAGDWLLKQQAADGSIGSPKAGRFLEEHAMASAALCEIVSLTAAVSFKEPARKAVDFLLSVRAKDKGWGGPTATGWAIIALLSAKRADLLKSDAEAKEALDALKPGKKAPTFERALHLAVDLEIHRPKVDAAVETLKELKGSSALRFDPYLAFVMIVARKRGDPAWADDVKSLVATLNDSQNGKKADKCLDGSWNPSPQSPVAYGRVTATCYHLLTAEVVMDYANGLFPSK